MSSSSTRRGRPSPAADPTSPRSARPCSRSSGRSTCSTARSTDSTTGPPRCDLPERFMIGDVSWWNHVRIIIRWDVHELALWRHVLDLRRTAGAIRHPGRARRPRRAGRCGTGVGGAGRTVRRSGSSANEAPRGGPPSAGSATGCRPAVQSLGRDRSTSSGSGPVVGDGVRARRSVLDARLDAIRTSGTDVLSIVSARVFQLVRIDGQDRFVEPNLAFALDRLGADGLRIATLAVAADHRSDADWARIADDPRSVPRSIVRTRYSRSRRRRGLRVRRARRVRGCPRRAIRGRWARPRPGAPLDRRRVHRDVAGGPAALDGLGGADAA